MRLQVVRIIDNEAVPLLRRCSLAGHATLKSPARVFTDHPLAADMCIDILSDRGTLTPPRYLQGLAAEMHVLSLHLRTTCSCRH